jgi:hypothetical protein
VPDLLLTALVDFVAHEGEVLLKQLATHTEAYEEVTGKFPPVTLILPGAIVSGNLVPYKIYSRCMRQLVEPTEGEEERAIEIGEAFLRRFYGSVDSRSKECESEAPLMEQLYLVNVAALGRDRPVEMPPLSISLEAVQGWTVGQIPL